jgi:MFS family permease
MTNYHIISMHQSAKHLAKSQNQLLLTVFLKAIADSLVTIYVPIYLLTHHVSLHFVLLYCIVVYCSTFLFVQLALKASQYLGVKKVLSSGILLTAAFYYMLYHLNASRNFILLALIYGAALGIYFGAYDMILTKSMKRSHEGNAYTYQQVAGMLAGVLAPLLGSLLIKEFSYQTLFLVVMVVLAMTPLPLFFSKDFRTRRESLALRTLLKGSNSRKRIDRAVFLQGVIYGGGTIWPLYLFIHYRHIVALGILASISAGLVMLFTFVIGRSIDKHQRSAYVLGSVSFAPTWVTRLMFISPVGLAFNAFASSVLAIAPTMAVLRDIYHIGKISKSRSAHFARVELYMDLGRICIFGVAFFASSLSIMFLVLSITTLFYASCKPKKLKPSRGIDLATA